MSARRLLAASVRQAPSPVLLLLVLSGLPVLAAAWAVLSPPVMLSKAMTQDLLFNLSGAWHVYSGHVAHVDFHDASGRLSFLLTALGFHLLGPTPFAFLVNVAIMGAVLFAASFLAAMRRLPLLPAVLFVVFATLLALMPANVGDRPEQYTFAMSYNRYGWSAYSILALILFVPPREERDRKDGAWIDIAVAGGLLAAMFYLKITYFAAGLATLGFAVLFHPHVGRYWRAWLVVGALLVLNALAPHNQPYLADILGWATSGAVRKAATLHFNNFVAAIDQYGPYLAAVAVGLWMWWSGRATFRLPLTLLFLLVMSLLLLSQNSQAAGMPSAIVVLFVLYDRLRTAFSSLGNRDVAPWLLTLLLFPLFAVGGYATSIAGYHANARDGRGVHVVERTNLRGLAVPEGQRGTFLSFSHSFDYPSRPSGRAGPAALPAFGLRIRAGAHGRGGPAQGPGTGRHRPAGQRQSPALHAGRRARARREPVVDVECAQAASQRVPGRRALRPGAEVRDQPAMDRRHDAPLWRLSGGALPLGSGDAVLDLADAVQSRPAGEREPGSYLTRISESDPIRRLADAICLGSRTPSNQGILGKAMDGCS